MERAITWITQKDTAHRSLAIWKSKEHVQSCLGIELAELNGKNRHVAADGYIWELRCDISPKEEIWRDILVTDTFATGVSSLGRVINFQSITEGQTGREGGRRRLTFYKDGQPLPGPFWVDELVCRAFHGPQPQGRPYVYHINGDLSDSRESNLRWSEVPQRERVKAQIRTWNKKKQAKRRAVEILFAEEDS